MNQLVSVQQRLDVDRSLRAIFRRRLNFTVRYFLARRRSTTIARLRPIIENSFEHPWVAGVEIKFRFRPGNEIQLGRPWRAKLLSSRSMHWDAPIAVSVFRVRRGRRREALCMSLFLIKDILYIAQIQGIAGTDAPKELRDWPKMLIKLCRTFVRQEGLRELRVAKAESLYSYRGPQLNPELTASARENTLRRIRKGMRLLYDANAVQLGFVLDGDWFRWQPNAESVAEAADRDVSQVPLIAACRRMSPAAAARSQPMR